MEAESRPHNAPAGTIPDAGAPTAGYQAGAAVPPWQQFGNPLDRFWNLYLVDAERADKKLTDGWKGDMDGILIFTGLFATTVGSFIIAVFPSLSPDPSADTNALLMHIAQQQISGSNSSQLHVPLPSDSFKAPLPMLRINVLWMLSFFLSLCCALAATLVQQWTRQYLADSQPRGPPSKRGPIHAYLQAGIGKFGFAGCVDSIVTLLHISVFLFMSGLLEFAFNLHLTVAYNLLGFAIVGAVVYLILTTLPVLYSDCPYKTPLTLIIRPFKVWYRSSCLFILWKLRSALDVPLIERLFREESVHAVWDKFRSLRSRIYEIRGRKQTLTDLPQLVSCQHPLHVFSQMARSLDEDVERHQYLLTLPSYLESLSKMKYPMKSVLEAGEWYSPLIQILESYRQRRISGSPPLSPKPLEDLIILESAFLAEYRSKPLDNLLPPLNDGIVVSDWGPQIDNTLSPTLWKRIDSGWGWYGYLLSNSSSAISLLSFCRTLSTDLAYPYEFSVLDYDLPCRRVSRTAGGQPTSRLLRCDDKLLRSFPQPLSKVANLYRLLYFTRGILHYSAEQNELLKTYKHIWAPVLRGLHDLTLESELRLLSDATRSYVYELVSVIGRDDLLPHPNLGLPPSAKRHDYSAVFDAHPELGGCLRTVIFAMGHPSKYRHILPRHYASIPELGLSRHSREDILTTARTRERIALNPLELPKAAFPLRAYSSLTEIRPPSRENRSESDSHPMHVIGQS